MPIELMFTEPHDTRVQTRTVADSAEVETVAGELLARYQTSGDVLPGIELRREGGESLSIAVAPFGWALVHTDTDFDQRCTRRAAPAGGAAEAGRHEVRWEEPDTVPTTGSSPTPDALAGVSQWMADASLTTGLIWSDQCL
jgi:hypothetical protein